MECNSVYIEAMERCPQNFPDTILPSPRDAGSHVCWQRQLCKNLCQRQVLWVYCLGGQGPKMEYISRRIGKPLALTPPDFEFLSVASFYS